VGGAEPALKSADETRIDPAQVAGLYEKHADELRCFVLGVLRDPDLTGDVLQNTFAKAAEVGHTAHEETVKGWLFRVAFNEAMALKRRQSVHERATRRIAEAGSDGPETPDELVCRWETVAAVRAALDTLPAEQAQVVRMRIYEQKKFITIAEELGVPLGTVLTRMQAALKKLRLRLQD
jgi:RNA polymerase sigma-70 factor (ECF subfamily)